MLASTLSLLLLGAPAADGISSAPGTSDRPRLVVLHLGRSDDVSEELATRLSTTLRLELMSQAGFEILAGDELVSVLDPLGPATAPTCADDDCLKEVAGRTGASLVAWGRVFVDGSPVLEANLFDAAAGRTVSSHVVRGAAAVAPQGAAEAAHQLLADASGRYGLGPSGLLRSGWLASGVVVGAAATLVTVASVGTAAFSAFVFFNGIYDPNTRELARWVNAGASVTAVAGLLGMATGAGLATVAFVVEE